MAANVPPIARAARPSRILRCIGKCRSRSDCIDLGPGAVKRRPSALLRHALGWRVGRESHPGVSGLFPHRDRRCGKIWLGKGAERYGNVTGKALALPVDRGPACRAEVEGERVAALRLARPGGRLAGERNLLATKARLVADHSTSAALALQTVAHGDARGLALDGEVELAAAAGGSATGHACSNLPMRHATRA